MNCDLFSFFELTQLFNPMIFFHKLDKLKWVILHFLYGDMFKGLLSISYIIMINLSTFGSMKTKKSNARNHSFKTCFLRSGKHVNSLEFLHSYVKT